MTKRKFKIKEEGYWAGNGCDCCEPDYFSTYDIFEVTSDGEHLKVNTNGTPHELEDAYHGLLEHLGVEIEVEYSDD